MIPTNTGNTSPCSNISSNCVVWQGPDIPCISLCNGDTISDVIAKLAEELCAIVGAVAGEPDLSGLDLLCVLPDGQSEPDTLEGTLQLIINAICNFETAGKYTLPNVTLADCLQYEDGLGNPVTELPLDDYATLIGNKVCDILDSILIIQTTLSDHESRLIILENCVLPCSGNIEEVKVISSCVLEGEGLVALSELVLELETRFCDLETAVGSPALISTSINAQCILGSDKKLDGEGTYGSIPDWVTNPTTLAESNKNLWLVVCDMHKAIEDIKLNCCPGACDSIVYDFGATVIRDANDIPTSINVSFLASDIPSGYSDCGGSTTITLKDKNNATVNTVFSIEELQDSTEGLTISLGSLFKYADFTLDVDFCTTNGTDTCNENVTKTLASDLICPTNVTLSDATEESFKVTFNQYMGTSAVYTINAVDVSTSEVAATETVTNPTSTVVKVIDGLDESTEYEVSISVSLGGESKDCGLLGDSITTGTTKITCDSGIDVAVLFDYTGSMGGSIELAKTGISNLITTVDNVSGDNIYRMSLILADEVDNDAAVNYAEAADYVSLPTGQKYKEDGVLSDPDDTTLTDIHLTAMEMFGDNNGSTFTTQLNKLNNQLIMGSGKGGPEPVDRALDRSINHAFGGTWRNNVAKYIFIVTDNAPSGLDDDYSAQDLTDVTALANQCATMGIKVSVMGPGYANPAYIELVNITGGVLEETFDSTSIANSIENLCT